MSAYSEFAEVTARIATIPNILRTRAEDLLRLEWHGALNGEMEARVAVAVTQLRKALDELEKTLA